jgi:hypothetical protein
MAANPKSPVGSGTARDRSHVYHAEAYVLSGQLEHPIKQTIEPYGRVALETRRESIITQRVAETNVEGLISFKSGHTRVVGTQVKQKTDIFGNDHAGWVTLSTSVIEGFNVVDILTADRVVAQVSTEHPMKQGHVPKVTFLGTRFENLRIGGYPVEVELDLGICGNKPEDDRPYLEDNDFLDRVERQLDSIADAKGLPETLEKKCGAEIAYIDDLRQRAKQGAHVGGNGYSKLQLQCSLVKSIGPIPIPGVRTFGNLIFIPNFGTVALAELEVGVSPSHGGFSENMPDGSSAGPSNSTYFTLNMMKTHLGCPTVGPLNGPVANANGSKGPGK